MNLQKSNFGYFPKIIVQVISVEDWLSQFDWLYRIAYPLFSHPPSHIQKKIVLLYISFASAIQPFAINLVQPIELVIASASSLSSP